MPLIARSSREAVGLLVEQVLPGDFVRVRAQQQAPGSEIMGRVLDANDPALAALGRRPNPARMYVQTADGQVNEFDPADLDKINAAEIPGDLMPKLSSQDQKLTQEVLADLGPGLVEEFGLRADPERSMTAKLAQRMPDVRSRKSFAMRNRWRRAKNRSGSHQLGHEPSLMRSESKPGFAELLEQDDDSTVSSQMRTSPDLGSQLDATSSPGGPDFSANKSTFRPDGKVDPRVAYNMTMRVFEATNSIMKSLAISRSMPYFMWVQDDPEEGMIRLKLNGTCPKEIVERFAKSLDDIELTILEKPEGDEKEKNLIGNWVFEAKLEGFPDEYQEPNYTPEQPQPATAGQFPGEVVLPEEPGEGGGVQ